jgi:diguanylate cyclase (GGDEF)-like protein/PAS domain S-box-containing protein
MVCLNHRGRGVDLVEVNDVRSVAAVDVGSALVAARLPDAVVVIDTSGIIKWANEAAVRTMGRPVNDWVGASAFGLVPPDDLAMAAVCLESVQGKDVGTPIELRVATGTGWRLVELVGSHMGDGSGSLILSMRDLTERRRWEVSGNDTSRFRAIVHHACSLTLLVDADGIVQSVSAAVTRVLGQDPEMVCGRPATDLVVPAERPLLAAAFAQAGRDGNAAPAVVEAVLATADGDGVPFELTVVSLLDDPTVEGFVVSGHDITRLRAAQDTLTQLAHYDSLTGLANRRTFEAQLEREWVLTSRDGIDSYVVVADLDEFKAINDSRGHAAGDDVLRRVAHAMRQVARETDIVARIGGDEFAVLLIRCGGEAAALGFVERLNETLAQRPWRDSHTISVSLGHHSLRHSNSPADAVHRADLAMLACKQSRR